MFSYNIIIFGFFNVFFSSVQYCYFSNQSFVKISNQIAYLFNNFSHYTMLLLCNQTSSTFILSVSPQDCLQLNRQREFLAIFNDSEKKTFEGCNFSPLHAIHYDKLHDHTQWLSFLYKTPDNPIGQIKWNTSVESCLHKTNILHPLILLLRK